MARDLRSVVFRYGLAIFLFAAVIGVALILKYFDYQINLTILVVVAIVAASVTQGTPKSCAYTAIRFVA